MTNIKEISTLENKNINYTIKRLTILIYVMLGFIFVLGTVIMYLGKMINSDIALIGVTAMVLSLIYLDWVATLPRNKRGA